MDTAKHLGHLNVLVMGVGNSLLTDEAVGPQAIKRFQEAYGELLGVSLLDAGTLSFTLADEIGAADALIVFDAARLNATVGSVRVLEGKEMDDFVRSGKLTVHEVGLTDLLDMARMTGDLPARRALVAIEPAHVGWGLELSPAVEAAMPTAIQMAHDVLSRWNAECVEAAQ
ncbi:HyaD/HybD family hydrogenase maturation endopeptidase [Celeribacter litoreus]|uniref:HyaD/HybD family hydrogenase maturation endopeptidase n=1 Tax=Celeribacter litoreus TaxID=2876714 RepID=UPI001CCD60DA|nr:HyaD/HybD family hydrogenase maturation endopeptidase [Celeribacter litoreus]MCA0044373.1 HyaD/HybD family hydrogenase maturation endopeptidase [Celeribacter litoreus]